MLKSQKKEGFEMDEIYMKIRELRIARGMSQEELAKRTGYKGRSAIAKLESGHFDLAIDKVGVFAQALGTTPAFLMGWDEDERLETLINMIEGSEDRISKIAERLSNYSEEELDDLENYMSFIEAKRG